MGMRITVNADQVINKIDRNIYGHFSEHLGRCIYGGLWVGEDSPIPNDRGLRLDVIDALKRIKIPLLRWPGGCFADEYHWKDGIGERSSRKRMVNTHWGGVVENNHFGTHEFMLLCEILGCEPYVNGNVGSGTVQEMQEWVEYMTFGGESPMSALRAANGRTQPWKMKYFGVGNENWGCGGNMRAEYYADEYRRYQTYVRNYGENKIYRIAGGPCVDDYHWTEVLMREAAKFMEGLSLHHYAYEDRWDNKKSATNYDATGWFKLLKSAIRMDELVTRHSTIMDKYDPDKRVALIVDEWGAWHEVEPGTNPGFLYQQNTIRDALVAGSTLNIFNNHSERVRMANIAQTVNVLQAVVLTEGSDLILTPTWHVFDLYSVHQNADRLAMKLESASYELGGERLDQINASVSRAVDGTVNMTICNISHETESIVPVEFRGLPGTMPAISARILTASTMTAKNTFAEPNTIQTKDFKGFTVKGNTVTLHLPPMSVVLVTLKNG